MFNSTIKKGKSVTTGKGIVAASIIAIGLYAATTHAQTITSNQTGTNNSWYYSFWNDNSSGSASMTLGSAGNYSTTWSNVGNFTAGKGWSTGGRKTVNFSGSFNGGSNGYLAIYGWTTSPLVEYYIVENHGSWVPPGGTSLGAFTSDGGTYNIYHMTRTNAPCITGNSCNFDQFWSVRTSTRSSGTVTTGNHFDAWKAKGLNMGTFNYMILETEGYQSSGSSNVTVSEGSSSSSSSSSTSSSSSSASGGSTPPSGNVILRARHSSACVDAAGTSNSTTIQQYSCSGGSNQSWSFVSNGSGWYSIKGAQSGRCLDVAGSSTADGATVQLYDCSNGNNQQWKISAANDGTGNYEITNRNSSKCLTVAGSSTANGAKVQQSTCSWGSNQQFKFN